ncbi:MAG TPA: protein kinase [Bryobacteraceae bacterium]|jgi:serine/threonine protein kinase/tetratricopeptide (TPR) repeat protein
MTADRWTRVKELFETARQIPPPERERLLLEETDPEISGEVRALLASYDTSPDFMEEPALASRSGDVVSAMAGTLAGTRIGSWRLLRQVGEGGMGVVYEAARDDEQFDQRAAVKILKHWTLGAADVSRFRTERQILAGLDHPNIARLLDGGATTEGLPFYAMTFVEGEPIDKFCSSHKLGVREHLKLFRKVCDAVVYAHQRGIVHRDLKPANILVEADATPKLLDFGIAKVLDPGGSITRDKITQTSTLNRLATPFYASPEQLKGGEITPASDIYSLGLLLYELLTGHHPFHDGRGNIHLVATAICERDPERPSVRAGEKSWARDLDRVVLKALERDPKDRYASAGDLSAAIGRYLDEQPVNVRVPTLDRRSRRSFFRISAAAAVFPIVAAVTWWAASNGFHKSAPGPRRSIAVLGFQNLSGRPDASWISTALSEMLATELASTERVRLVSNETVTQVTHDLDVPEMQPYPRETLDRLRANLKVDYFVTGSFLSPQDNSVKLYVRLQDAQSGQIIAGSTGTGAATQLPSLVNEAVDELLRGTEWRDVARGRPQGALRPFANAASTRLHAQGVARLAAFDTAGARDLFAQAIAADPKNPVAHSALSGTFASLGYEEKAQAEAKLAYDLSAPLPREERLSIEGRYHEVMHDWLPAIATDRNLWELFSDNPEYGLRLARVENLAGKPKEALATLADLRARQPAANRADPRIDLEEARSDLLQSDFRAQLDAATRAAESASRLNAHLLTASALQAKGDALYGLDRLDEALPAYQSAEAIYRERGDDFGAASILHREGRLYWKRGDYQGQSDYNQKALAMFEKIGNKSAIPTVLQNLALAKLGRGDSEGGIELLERSAAISRELAQKKALSGSLNNAGNLLRRLNRPDEARRNYEECLAIAVQLNDRDQIARSHITLEMLDFDEGDLGSALDHLREAWKTINGSPDSLLKASILQHRGDVEKAKREHKAARQSYEAALAISRALHADQYTADSQTSLADIAGEQGDFQTAYAYLASANSFYIPRKQKAQRAEAALVEARVRIADHNPSAARPLIDEALAGYRAVKSAAGETAASALSASYWLALHKPAEAQGALTQSRAAFSQLHDFQGRMRYRFASAQVASALGNRAGAAREMRDILAELESKNWAELSEKVRAALAHSSN